MSQVLRRARCRASNSGLRIDAACLTAEIIAGPRSLAFTVILAPKVARMIAAGRGTIFDDVGNCSLRTCWPICGSGSLRVSVATSLADRRAMLDNDSASQTC